MNLSVSFTEMSLFTPESSNYASSSLVVKGLCICLSANMLGHQLADVSTRSSPLIPWECLGILYAIRGASRGIRFKNAVGTFDILGLGDCSVATLMRLWMQGNNFKPLEARPHWSAKCRSQGHIFRHLDRELVCLGTCGLDSWKDSQSFEEWSERGLDLELDLDSIPSSATSSYSALTQWFLSKALVSSSVKCRGAEPECALGLPGLLVKYSDAPVPPQTKGNNFQWARPRHLCILLIFIVVKYTKHNIYHFKVCSSVTLNALLCNLHCNIFLELFPSSQTEAVYLLSSNSSFSFSCSPW